MPRLLLLAAVFALGCAPTPSFPERERFSPTEEPTLAIQPGQTGTVSGRVVWAGPQPEVPISRYPHFTPQGFSWRECRNPLAPQVSLNAGVRQAVIELRGGNVRTTKPWPHGPVTVAMRDSHFRIAQDGQDDLVTGFVRRGDTIEMVSHDPDPNSVRARGASFFTLQFPDPDRSLSRSFGEPGLVELSSASNHFFSRAFLFVADHPYIARSDASGNFVLTDVPPGQYDVVCWVPNYLVDQRERDPETSVIARQWYRPPVEIIHSITVAAGQTTDVPFALSEPNFTADR